ncbi:hypothetical protein FACS1894105_14270 [Clostridia bacterium]|nr:hypothetical protein FACS1894105_14270 [Clostridia bacterium]
MTNKSGVFEIVTAEFIKMKAEEKNLDIGAETIEFFVGLEREHLSDLEREYNVERFFDMYPRSMGIGFVNTFTRKCIMEEFMREIAKEENAEEAFEAVFKKIVCDKNGVLIAEYFNFTEGAASAEGDYSGMAGNLSA